MPVGLPTRHKVSFAFAAYDCIVFTPATCIIAQPVFVFKKYAGDGPLPFLSYPLKIIRMNNASS